MKRRTKKASIFQAIKEVNQTAEDLWNQSKKSFL